MPIRFDRHYASRTGFGRPLVGSTFTVALAAAQSVIPNRGWNGVRLPAPVFEGDAIYSQSEVLHFPGVSGPEPEGPGGGV